ncbi:dTDP-4-dehydrorhamnose 3,5-epimerase [Sphingobium sp. RSMS]|uniref:dTDP-4-dehydrorhamnose 3,5-epimerase n=1 Tax=Sphingobium sp. RSMS TaxID=520734 RepID=UPI0010F7B0C6|nr:dTDP-4-dehydrorhamnose 3,5-epimerase [Sphingobium sp. RSMS]UXC89777.1 dTDP-4-dehydrorhamnose 3,5-epimerase [Sphingobium sp. RSMS]
MQIQRFNIPDVVHFEPRKFGDHRGYFSEIFRQDWFIENIGQYDLVQENQSLSATAGTVRGLHFQTAPFVQGKLVRCLSGALIDTIVDIRHGSPTFGQWMSVELTAERGNQLWVPPGFAHGFCTLRSDTILCYKVTAYYSAENDEGLAWDDPAIGIDWPTIADPHLLSAKDKAQPKLAELPAYFTYGAC